MVVFISFIVFLLVCVLVFVRNASIFFFWELLLPDFRDINWKKTPLLSSLKGPKHEIFESGIFT
jgi:hypothetical protein